MRKKKKNRLYYFDSDIEVRQGDYVIFKTLILRRKKSGRVGYVPKLTGYELLKQKKEPEEDWLIEVDDGTVLAWSYIPEDSQPSKRISFVKRGEDNYQGMTSKELDEIDSQ